MCEGAVLPVLLNLLQDKDVEVQANAVGVVMYTVILTRGANTLKFTNFPQRIPSFLFHVGSSDL